MAWTNLPTNFKNLVWSGLKKYRQYTNQDNTVSFEDVTEYDDTEGTQMSASQLNQMTGAINKLMTGIASDFSSSINYAVGDYCMYNDQLYRFTTAHPAGSWNSSHVTAVSKITNELTKKLSDAPSDNKEYVRKNGDWAEASGGGGGGGASWGSITGTLSDQTDLQNALDGKSNTGHTHDDRYYTEQEVNTRLAGKLFIYSSDTLSYWDDTPTADSTKPVTSRGIKTALDGKANNSILGDAFSTSAAYAVGDYCIYEGALYRFTSAHSAGAWNSSHVTQVVAMNELAALSAQLESRMTFKITGTVSASNYTLTDSRINNNHWEVDQIYFATPSNVTSQIHWTTDITNHTVSLSATYAGSTNVVVKMHWVQ